MLHDKPGKKVFLLKKIQMKVFHRNYHYSDAINDFWQVCCKTMCTKKIVQGHRSRKWFFFPIDPKLLI